MVLCTDQHGRQPGPYIDDRHQSLDLTSCPSEHLLFMIDLSDLLNVQHIFSRIETSDLAAQHDMLIIG